ncbi:MAG TPA: FHA domain-containing protein, partial [Vicinamibacteria bacterium]
MKRANYWGVLTFLLWFAATSQGAAGAPQSPASPQSEDAWGYLWQPRTLQLHALTDDVIEVGRLTSSDVVLAHPLVSRHHLEIRRTGNGAVVVDLRSTNGTHLNRRELRAGQEVPLQGGDLIAPAGEELIFQWTKESLFEDALRYSLLARLVVLRVPVLQDRIIRALGQEREILGLTEAEVDLDKETVRVTHGNETEARAFEPDEKAFVGDVAVEDGGLRLSIWGVARDAPLQSRRAAYSNLVHGELWLRLAGTSPEEGRARFASRWAELGMQFLMPVLYAVMDNYSESESAEAAPQIARGLSNLASSTALRDGARCLAFLARLDPNDSELPADAARAEARWVKTVAEAHKAGLDDVQRKELVAALERG